MDEGRENEGEASASERAEQLARANDALVREIAERRRAEESLRLSEDNFRSLIERSPDPLLIVRRGEVIYANGAAQRYFGAAERSGLVGGRLLDIVHPEDRPSVLERIALLEAGKSVPPTQQRMLHCNGEVLFGEAVGFPIVFDGEFGTVTVVRDVSARKQAERALREAEERFRLTFDHAPIGMALVAPDGKWLRVNHALCEIVGYTTEELFARRFQDITHPDDLEADVALVAQVLRGEISRYRLAKRYVRKDGAIVDVTLHVSLVRTEEGEPLHFIAQIEDVTESRRMEARLAMSDRMASLGTLAAGVAHEVNNPLTYVLSNLDALDEELRAFTLVAPAHGSKLDELVGEAKEGAERVRRIVRDLMLFSRTDEERRVAVDLRRVLDRSTTIAFNEIKHRATLVKEYGDIPFVEADEARLGQVFVNLLVNAAQAIPEGRAEENEIRIVTGLHSSGRVFVDIRDTGEGIPPNVLGRILEPFFTTKPVGVGSGLGLSICHGIVTGLGGEIVVDSEVGKGTTFRVLLPASRVRASERAARLSVPAASVVPSRPPVAAPAQARVLVVDDEPLVAAAVRRALRGNTVVVARSGKEALDVLRDDPRFDAIVCDLMMPEVTGMDLHAALSTLAPDLAERMIFVTGGAFTASAREFLERVKNARLEKPFDVKVLHAVVQQMRERKLRHESA